MKIVKHSPLPWRVHETMLFVVAPAICECFGKTCAADNAIFIVQAANSHYDLLKRVEEQSRLLAEAREGLAGISSLIDASETCEYLISKIDALSAKPPSVDVDLTK